MSDSLTDVLRVAISSEMASKLNTCLPAIVERGLYPAEPNDPSGEKVARIDVIPAIDKKYIDGTSLKHKIIFSVPVVFPRTSKVAMTFPLEKGDGVLLIFAQRSIENYLFSSSSSQNSPEKFSLSDAIAIPGLFPFNTGTQIQDTSLQPGFPIGDGTKFRIETKDVDIVVTNGKASIETDGLAVKINSDGLTVDA